jgi:hypothetical protein
MKIKGLKEFGCVLAMMVFCAQSNATSFPAMPTTIRDYLDTSDVVVTGRIGRIIKVHSFYGYQEGADKLAELDKASPIPLGLPMVDYEVIVDETLKSDDFYSGGAEPLVLRVVRDPATSADAINDEEYEGELLLFLSRNPDNETYGFYTFAHKINLDEKPEYYFEGEVYEVLSGSLNRDDLITAVIREIGRQ